jgi:hypothetical protein
MVLNTTAIWYPITSPNYIPLVVTLNTASNITTTSSISKNVLQTASAEFNNVNFVFTSGYVDGSGNFVATDVSGTATGYQTTVYVGAYTSTTEPVGSGFALFDAYSIYFQLTNVTIPFYNIGFTGTLQLLNLNIPMSFYTYSGPSELVLTETPITVQTAIGSPSSSYLQGVEYSATITNVLAFLTEQPVGSEVVTSLAGIISSATIVANSYVNTAIVNSTIGLSGTLDTKETNYISVSATQLNTTQKNSSYLGMIYRVSNVQYAPLSFSPNLFVSTACPTSGLLVPTACNSTLTNCASIAGTVEVYNLSNNVYNSTTRSGTAQCTGFDYKVINNTNLTGPSKKNNYNLTPSVIVQSIQLNYTVSTPSTTGSTMVTVIFTLKTSGGSVCFSVQTDI